MKSANYVAGLAGWQISKDGNAEFNNGTFRGPLRITGPNNAVISIDATLTYPTMFFYSKDGTNKSQLSLINAASVSTADFWISSGQWTPGDAIPRAARLYMAGASGDLVYLGIARLSDGAILGGIVEMNGSVARFGFRDQGGTPAVHNRLDIDRNGASVTSPYLDMLGTTQLRMQSGTLLKFVNNAALQRDNPGTVTKGDAGKGVVNYATTNGSSASTVAGAPFSAKIVCVSLSQWLENGRAYGIQILGGFHSPTSAAISANFYLHQGASAGAGAVLWDYLWNPQYQNEVRPVPAQLGYIRNVASGTYLTTLSIQMNTDGSGIGTHYADANHVRGMVVYDVGDAADFPWATNM